MTTASNLTLNDWKSIADTSIVIRGSSFRITPFIVQTTAQSSPFFPYRAPGDLSGLNPQIDGFSNASIIFKDGDNAIGVFTIAYKQNNIIRYRLGYGQLATVNDQLRWNIDSIGPAFSDVSSFAIFAQSPMLFICPDPPSTAKRVSLAIYQLLNGIEGIYTSSGTTSPWSTSLYFSMGDFDPDAPINPGPDTPGVKGDNPYSPGGESDEGGGGGSFDDDSDPIPDSSLPSISSANTGFTRIYNPSLSQVQDLARYLWTDDTVIETIWNHIKQFFENPMEAIIGFNLVPCAVPNGGTKNFALMYIDTGVQMTVAANQFVDVDCGALEIKEYFGSALDYSPYTKISCFLPFIGTVQLNTDEVMKSTLQVKYRIDICSGSCVAKILVDGSVLYQYSGHCAIPIPISAADFSSYVSAAVSVAKLAIGAAVGGGMGALMAGADNPAQQTNQIVTTTQTTETGRNPATGRQITLGTKTTVETRESPADQSSTQASFSGIVASNISNTVGQIMTAKPHVEHSGSFSGNTGYLGVRRPYVIIQRPNMCMPAQYQQFNGFPSMITETLSSLKGFTRVQQVQLIEMSATNPEQAEILEFLKSGVII